VLAILFGARLVMRATAGGAGAPPTGGEASTAGGSGEPDVAGVIALPPLIFLAFLAAATVLEAVVPLPVLAAHALARYLAGATLAVCGLVLIAMGASRFVAAGTNIPPNLPTTATTKSAKKSAKRNAIRLNNNTERIRFVPTLAPPILLSLAVTAGAFGFLTLSQSGERP
jgi:hypothetical protein